MSDEVLDRVGVFVRKNRDEIYEVNIYGGEPFLDVEHFVKCADELYDHDQNFFVSTNGSFLASPARFEAVMNWCSKHYKYNKNDLSAIRISNTIFHNKCRSDRQKSALHQFEWVLKEPNAYWCEYTDFISDEEPNYYGGGIPILWCEPDWHESESMFYIDKETGYDALNPSGRALTTGAYVERGRICSCIITSSYDDFDELWDDVGNIQFYPNGDIGICCKCKSGVIGNVLDFSDVEEVKTLIEKFRQKMRLKDKVHKNHMEETCDNCRRCKVSNSAQKKVKQCLAQQISL
jgi:hypothetical protein